MQTSSGASWVAWPCAIDGVLATGMFMRHESNDHQMLHPSIRTVHLSLFGFFFFFGIFLPNVWMEFALDFSQHC